jgi:Na+-driven multidrug efflux pump
VVLLLLRPAIVGVFTQDAAVRHTGTLALRIIGTGYVFYGIGMVVMQALNGAGDTRTPTLINFGGFWLFQIPLALLLAKGVGLGATGAFISIPVAETAIALAAVVLFRRGKWKRVQV